jgi:hypothetical protein
MRLATAVLVTGAAFATALILAAVGALSQGVTLTVERYFDPACAPLPGMAPSSIRGGCQKLRLSGTISSGAANEYVAVLYRSCGSSGIGHSLVGAQTKERGLWEAEWGATPGVYRARWNQSLSGPVRYRGPVPLFLTRLSGTRQRVSVWGEQDMKGRMVELQRLVAGQWRLLRRGRFGAPRGAYGVDASATFIVARRGLTLRAFVPAKSASPCYVATPSETWTSGARTGTPAGAGARVVDRTFLCPTVTQGGIRMVTIRASNASGEGAAHQEASVSVSTGHSTSLVSATTTGLSLEGGNCTTAASRAPLGTGDLKPRSPGLSGTEFECEAPRRVLIRVRAVFRAPTSVESNPASGAPSLSAQGEISEASVAVRTPGGERLALASVSGSGKARLFAARGCVEDDT